MARASKYERWAFRLSCKWSDELHLIGNVVSPERNEKYQRVILRLEAKAMAKKQPIKEAKPICVGDRVHVWATEQSLSDMSADAISDFGESGADRIMAKVSDRSRVWVVVLIEDGMAELKGDGFVCSPPFMFELTELRRADGK